jgi:peptide/nickel transport system permease protein
MKGPAGKLKRFLRHPSGIAGSAILLVVLASAILAGVIYPDGPWRMVARPMLWPGRNPAYILGTDGMGRDILAGLMHGARMSILVGMSAAIVSVCVGSFVGSVAGYYGGLLDDLLMRITDAVQTIPSFLAAIVIVGVIGPSLTTIVISISVVSWPMIAKLVRAEFLRLRGQDFVLACRIMGMSDARIIVTEILPNCLSPIVVAASVLVATAIIVESGLSFLGLGDPNMMSWGAIIGGGRSALRTAWYITVVPSVAVVLTVLALNLMGDALNDVLNPRLRAR